MVIRENVTIGEDAFVKFYSDADVYIKKDGTEEVYVEAIDVVDAGFTYTETETPIPADLEGGSVPVPIDVYEGLLDKSEAAEVLLGEV